jgi:hypothetical protein
MTSLLNDVNDYANSSGFDDSSAPITIGCAKDNIQTFLLLSSRQGLTAIRTTGTEHDLSSVGMVQL